MKPLPPLFIRLKLNLVDLMPKVALITRSTIIDIPGGDTVQVLQTRRHLPAHGYEATLFKTTDNIPYQEFDLFHFFNLTRPADILYHLRLIHQPIVITPILIDYNEYDRSHRKGLSGKILSNFPPSWNEYIKTVGRWAR